MSHPSPFRALRRAGFALALVSPALLAQTPPPASDCLTENARYNNKMQFFICLNLKREASQDNLLAVAAECGTSSVKYAETFKRYMAVRTASNLLLDTVIPELRYNNKTDAGQIKNLMEGVNAQYVEFESYVQTHGCNGEKTKSILAVVPIIGALFDGRVVDLVKSWFHGDKDEQRQKAEHLQTQRWKSPGEFSAPFPTKAPGA